MRWWKRIVLGGYYYGTQPYRRRRDASRARRGRAPIIVLTYHRVSDEYSNGWTISPDDFESHICWLERHCELVSLEAAQQRIRSRSNDRPAVAITFDDGYAENCHSALPLLISRRIPCTYFVCTDNVLNGTPFEHDLIHGFRCRPNTLEQLQALARAGIEIGAHSRTHADLGRIGDPARLYDEIVAAGGELQAAVGTPIRYFAFPFGQPANLSAEAFRIAYLAGYEGVCSAYGGYNWPGDDAFHLQRFCVDGPAIRLKNLVTVDPLKERRTRRFCYGPLIEQPRTAGVVLR